jgi:hypothetical protein
MSIPAILDTPLHGLLRVRSLRESGNSDNDREHSLHGLVSSVAPG